MQSVQDINLQKQIDEALKKAKYKKVLYFYDESGNRKLLGVFDKKKASQYSIRRRRPRSKKRCVIKI